MPSYRQIIWKFSAAGWWLSAVIAFCAATFLFTLVDFAGARWLGVEWPMGPELFPNMALGFPLAFFQLIGAGLLVVSGIRLALSFHGMVGIVSGVFLVVVTAMVSFVTYIFFALWYQSDLMGRSL
jgi:hypothetical protein